MRLSFAKLATNFVYCFRVSTLARISFSVENTIELFSSIVTSVFIA